MTRLDIISDPICPWCYIGVTRLLRAMAARPNYEFAMRWRPYQLNPEMPAEGMGRGSYLATKFGGVEQARIVYGRIDAACREAGLEIDFATITRTPNTVDAHRVLHWAEAEGVQTPVALALFRAYFQQGRDIGDAKVLAGVAEAAGMDGAVVARLLQGDADRDRIQEESRAASEMGVTGVPTFILGGKYALVGAQTEEAWEKVIDDLTAAADDLNAGV